MKKKKKKKIKRKLFFFLFQTAHRIMLNLVFMARGK